MKPRIVFFGTPDFAVPTLEMLLSDPVKYEVVGVVTQPDRPQGRKLDIKPSKVKISAQNFIDPKSHKVKPLPIVAPEKASDPSVIHQISVLKPDLAVVVAFGQILKPELLNLFPLGALNIHASILPRWRGAAPIQWAILSEDPVTGVSIQKVVAELDAGDVIAQSSIELDETWDSSKLYSDLSRRGADLLRKNLPDFLAGKIKATPQDVSQVTWAPKIKKEQGLIDWTLRASQICARLRAFTPWPGIWTTRSGKTLKILRAQPLEHSSSQPPGYLVSQDKFGFAVQCGGATALLITVVQPESRARQPASEYLKGYPFSKGEFLGA